MTDPAKLDDDIEIYQAGSHDIEAVIGLFKKHYCWEDDQEREWARRCLSDNRAGLFLANRNGQAAGFIINDKVTGSPLGKPQRQTQASLPRPITIEW